MCGIIAIVRQRSKRARPSAARIEDQLDAGLRAISTMTVPDRAAILRAAELVEAVDAELVSGPGTELLVSSHTVREAILARTKAIAAETRTIEEVLEGGTARLSPAQTDAVSEALVVLRDANWAVAEDRVRTAVQVSELVAAPTGGQLDGYLGAQQALSAIDRLEVRGRDSAGLHLLVSGHGLEPEELRERLGRQERTDPLFTSGTVRVVGSNTLGFVYKAAAEIGELGDNVRRLRCALADDRLLADALAGDGARTTVLGHTRWASVGIISEPNAHPVDSREHGDTDGPYVTAVLNGDIDNYLDVQEADALRLPSAVTTDAKVIPTTISRRLGEGQDAREAFRRTVAGLEGSVAVVASMGQTPDRLHLALRGSGQALYVGLSDEAFVVASEPYGVVELASRYLRLDGETPGNPDNPTTSRGQIVELDREGAGTLEGLGRWAYDGTALSPTEADLDRADITTRDIDRGAYPHFLLKEITEAPGSFQKTLRARIRDVEGRLVPDLGAETLPEPLRARLRRGSIRRVLLIGQGTAAIAGRAVASTFQQDLLARGIGVEALPATELSGFGLSEDMTDTVVVAVSQSGTTTDTNRTVDLVRARGATVLAIVNRRNSDLCDKADGVLFTSDGRDVEMSVASTKAFYAQVAAGLLLIAAIAEEAEGGDRSDDGAVHERADSRSHLLHELRRLPDAMRETLERRSDIAAAARELAPRRRYWAVVGNGMNHVAAQELRIKLSELCYKSIACDVTEDKKHIDLSAEPMILVCAAGLGGSNLDDVAKEVAIYRAHKASPIVIADRETAPRFEGVADAVITVPDVFPALAFVVATVAGHLFGYEAALAIDDQARPLRGARAVIADELRRWEQEPDPDDHLDRLAQRLEVPASNFFTGFRAGEYDGHLSPSAGARLSSLLRYGLGHIGLESYELEHGRSGTPAVLVEDLTAALTAGIDELTRPIDAIKHQAKTVTVGISRADETLLDVSLAKELLVAGAARDRLSYRTLRTVAALDGAIEEVVGYTRYRIEEWSTSGEAMITALDRGGVALQITTRTKTNPTLRGTKRQVARDRRVLVTRGRSDGRTLLIVPEAKGNQPTGITLLHVRLAPRLSADVARGVLQGYANRYAALRDAVTETEPDFDDAVLAHLPVEDLLMAPIHVLADAWRTESHSDRQATRAATFE